MQLSYARVKRNDTAGTSICPFRLVVRTLLFQGKNTGSIPVGDENYIYNFILIFYQLKYMDLYGGGYTILC